MKLLILFLSLCSSVTWAQTIKGKVIDFNTRESIPFADILVTLRDKSVLKTKTNIKGFFEVEAKSKPIQLLTSDQNYINDTISFSRFKKNNNVILLEIDPTRIIHTTYQEIRYVAEENNPLFDYKVNGESTVNFVDSLNMRQGRWLISHNDKYDKKSKYDYGQPMEIGYYKDNIKVGKWLILNPDRKIKRIINYETQPDKKKYKR